MLYQKWLLIRQLNLAFYYCRLLWCFWRGCGNEMLCMIVACSHWEGLGVADMGCWWWWEWKRRGRRYPLLEWVRGTGSLSHPAQYLTQSPNYLKTFTLLLIKNFIRIAARIKAKPPITESERTICKLLPLAETLAWSNTSFVESELLLSLGPINQSPPSTLNNNMTRINIINRPVCSGFSLQCLVILVW